MSKTFADETCTTRASAATVPPPPALRLDGVTKRFRTVVALEETWLKVEQGEFLTLLGPSGCGKSTLINLIAGFLDPDGGEIFLGSDLVTETPTHSRQIGVVFQNYALFPHMNVEKNIGYGLRMRGVAKAEAAERIGQAIDLVKLTGLNHRRPRELSGGQQQRVALARALVIRPKVLLLDEPFSALDKNLRGSMQVELKQIQRNLGVTTIFVTHDQSEALSLSDRIAVMSQGRIRQIGTPRDIYETPNDPFVAAFVGDMNVLRGRIESRTDGQALVMIGSLRCLVGTETLAGLGAGGLVDVFVRPDRIRIEPAAANALTARVVALVYQGTHVDVHADISRSGGGRIIARAAVDQLSAGVGDVVDLTLPDGGLVAFPSGNGNGAPAAKTP